MTGVTVRELVEALDMKILSGESYLDREIATSDISRPGLELTGYFNYYPSERVQLFGRNETSYMSKMTSDERLLIMRRLSRNDTPVYVYARGIQPEYEVLQAAEENGIPVIGAKTKTTQLSSNITDYLQRQLAERTSMHGVLVDVYGLGILIMGPSGVGKSETALELVKSGHRLVADDRVDLYQSDDHTIIGEPPAILQNMMEIRGLGIIDVMTLYGAGAVRPEHEIDMIIYLKHWNPGDKFDRLGSEPEIVNILGVGIPRITLPVQTGRNISNIVEVAAINFRARNMGYDAVKKFEENLTKLIKENKE